VPDCLNEVMARTLAALASDARENQLARTSSPGGTQADRTAAAQWLQPRFSQTLDPARLLLTNGTQSAVLLLFQHLIRPGHVLLAENLSYGVLRDLARVAGVRVIGVPLDDDGLIPEALEEACRRHFVDALYCNPTFHNPTASVMSLARRRQIVALASRYGFRIIEDDPIGRLYTGLPPPLAALDAERTWFVCGLTKCISQSTRIAYVVAPDAHSAATLIRQYERLTHWVPAPWMAATMAKLVTSGDAERVARDIADECTLREDLARKALHRCDLRSYPGSLHCWVLLPAHIKQQTAVEALAAAGTLVRPAALFAVETHQSTPEAIRLSLSSPLTRAEVQEGVNTVARVVLEL
jgi:DNA-binding transcriptional MocR family regulator